MQILKRLLKNPLSSVGLLLVTLFVAVAVAAPWLAPPDRPHEPYKVPRDWQMYALYSSTPQPPQPGAWGSFPPRWERHPFGTSEGQYDIYYGVIWGARTAFRAGLIVTGFSLLIGVFLGSLAGYFGGYIDELIMRLVDVFIALPALIGALVLTAILGKGLVPIMIALVVFGWPSYARLIRGDILSVKEREYVQAARAVGAHHLRIIFRHVLPNVIYPVLIVASLDIGSVVLSVAALSFLGLGEEVGYADWGQMISFARNWIVNPGGDPFQYWHTVVYPGAAIVLFVLGWNLIGDAFRDILDPRMRGSRS